MKIVNVEPLALTVELSITDCIALCDACMARSDAFESGGDPTLLAALGMGLLGSAFGAFLLSSHDAPHTIRHMWEMWAPVTCLGYAKYGRMPLPPLWQDQDGPPVE